jgi:hypothetical protein
MENIKLPEEWKAEAERTAEIPGNYLQGAQAVLTSVEKMLRDKVRWIDSVIKKTPSKHLKIQLIAARTELFILLENLTTLKP